MRELHRRSHPQRPGVGLLHAGDQPEHRRLARTVRPDHAHDSTRRQRKVHVFKQHAVAIAFGKFLRLDDQRTESRSGRDDDLELLLFFRDVFFQHRLVGGDACLPFRLAGLRAGTDPLKLARHRLLPAILRALRDRRTRLFLLQPFGIVSFPGDAVSVVEFQDPLGHVVQKVAVVRHRDDRARVTRKMLLQPLHALGIQMIGRLVQQQNVGFLKQQARKRDPALFSARKVIDDLVRRRTTQRVHRHLDLRSHIPRAERIDLFLQLSLLGRDRVPLGVVLCVVDFIPGRVVGCREIGEVFHAFLDTLPHGLARRELRLMFEQAHRVTGFEMHMAVELLVPPGQQAHQRGFAGPVEP